MIVPLILLLLQLPCGAYGVAGTLSSSSSSNEESYGRLTLDEIVNEMESLATLYPEFVTYDTSQNRYGLDSTCPLSSTNNNGCHNHLLIISDPIIYSKPGEGQIALEQRPDVFLSGALHGNERVGPVALIEVAKLLVKSASCQAKLTVEGNDCNALKETLGIDTIGWLTRLVTTRRIVIVPTPNASGYYSSRREESYISPDNNGQTILIDPNRDFSYDQDSKNQCMKSITARTINEIFLEHLFQMSMTYHGGIENITFEWGARSVPKNRVSPDDVAQRAIADRMSKYAGELNSSSDYYDTGDMNDILFPVYGGFEDWAYAGSWEKILAGQQCAPNEYYGGYPASKTDYDDATLRTFNFLVEISDAKDPPSVQYGKNIGLFDAPFEYDSNEINGYASKHIRTALMAIDIVEPYVEITKFKKKTFDPEIKPLKALRKIDENFRVKKWQKRRKKGSSKPKQNKYIEWTVGGSITVDETFLIIGKYSDFPDSFGSVNQLNQSDIDAAIEIATTGADNDNESQLLYVTEIQSGGTRWTDPTSSEVPKYSTMLDLTLFTKGDELAVFALAKVDQNWKDPPPSNKKVWPQDTEIQSHIVKTRTDENYTSSKVNIGRTVQGRLDWISVPLTILIR